MARTVLILFTLVAVLATASVATAEDFGLGIILGEPTGVSGKYWITSNTAIDGAAAWSFGNDDAFHLHADYLVHNLQLIQVQQGTLAVHFGVGGRIKFDNDNSVGVRVPVGLTYLFENAPVDIFFEVVPLLDIAPDTEFNPNAAIGVRYFFGGKTSY